MDLQIFDTNDLWLLHDKMTERRIEFNKLNCTGDTHTEFYDMMFTLHLAIMQELVKRSKTEGATP